MNLRTIKPGSLLITSSGTYFWVGRAKIQATHNTWLALFMKSSSVYLHDIRLTCGDEFPILKTETFIS